MYVSVTGGKRGPGGKDGGLATSHVRNISVHPQNASLQCAAHCVGGMMMFSGVWCLGTITIYGSYAIDGLVMRIGNYRKWGWGMYVIDV